jgi:cytochrome c oxidase assembly factor CtaG
MHRFFPLLLAVIAAGNVSIAFAHEAVGPSPTAVATAWSFDPGIVLAIVLFAWLYDLGMRNLWKRYGSGRVINRWQAAAFAAAVGVLVLALISPLDSMAASLFSAHMTQHMLLVLAVPPLLLFGRADLALPAALPNDWQRSTRRFLHLPLCRGTTRALLHPATAWWLFWAVFWAWHVPWLYQGALHHDTVHALEHVSLLAVSLLFWRVVLRAAGERSFPYPFAILFVFTTMLQMSVLAALLTFADRSWYPAYNAATTQWGISLLNDQRTGALVMWMTSNAAFLGMVALLFVRWFAVEERRANHHAVTTTRVP